MALAFPEQIRPASHVLFHAIFLLVHRLLPHVADPHAAVLAILPVMMPLPLLIFAMFKKSASNSLPDSVLMALSLGLTIMSPITIWTNAWMIGYINPIVYHNPTTIAVRLFVIPLSLFALRVFSGDPWRSANHRVYTLLLCAALLLLATLAKPSFTMALIPGCCAFAVWHWLKRRPIDWALLAFGICLPAVLMIGLQYLITYVSFEENTSIAIGFLTFMSHWIPVWRIPIQLLLSLVFPLGILLLYPAEALRNLYLKMSWTIFAAATAFTYLFYEVGPTFTHGNFLWISYSAVFLLMFASTKFLIEQHTRDYRNGLSALQLFGLRFSRTTAIGILLFGLHVLSGIAYYMRYLETPDLR